MDSRLTNLENANQHPIFSDVLVDTINVTRAVNVQGHDITLNDINTVSGKATTGANHAATSGNPHGTTFAQVESKPTTVSGYGITDTYTKTETDTLDEGLANSIASIEGRLTSIECLLNNLTTNDLLAQVVNITKALNLCGIDLVVENGTLKVKGNISATGSITPGVS